MIFIEFPPSRVAQNRFPDSGLIAQARAAKWRAMSSSGPPARNAPSRDYRLGKRALKQGDTRRRIVEAAVDLHSTVGPARTTVSQIAKRAGVQRHTYYAHFPDERGLFLACSGLAIERDPLPDIQQLKTIPAGDERIRCGLEQIYGWFERNSDHAACVLRDAEQHALTGEMVELRIAPTFREAAEMLGEGLTARSRAMLEVALDFACWKRLSRSYDPSRASALMSDAIMRVAPANK
jgi:AcrR family transcriptional regulator